MTPRLDKRAESQFLFLVYVWKNKGHLRVMNLALISTNNDAKSRSQWPRGQRLRSAAARLLRLWVRIPPGAWMSVVNVVCCQVEVSATS